MLNYEVAPSGLISFIPPGTELDFYQGNTFVSVVGFNFLNTRVFGCAFPFHRNFEEVNLRFYVRHRAPEGWRRGVVFIRELVPRRFIAFIARTCYGEPYTALPMRHEIQQTSGSISAKYLWCREHRWESLFAAADGPLEQVKKWFTRGIHHRTLLGLYDAQTGLHGISGRASALACMARLRDGLGCECRKALWRPLCRPAISTSGVCLYCRRFASGSPPRVALFPNSGLRRMTEFLRLPITPIFSWVPNFSWRDRSTGDSRQIIERRSYTCKCRKCTRRQGHPASSGPIRGQKSFLCVLRASAVHE
jgi:hypothetical protein